MEATLIVIDSDAELARAHAVVDQLMGSDERSDLARLAAQARLIAAYEEEKWPPRLPNPADVIRYLADQHGLKRADLVPLLGGAERVDDILRGRRQLTLAMVQRLRARFHVPADLLLPPALPPAARRASKNATAARSLRGFGMRGAPARGRTDR
jgi:HTH-type transcriptional regulator / antitoxin HigA